ncbi:hypothetical protein GF407_18635 [candidate division KSB1 bacterium]|nr:hypothetical protein [candidate division KSB1 bacterium]
MLKVLIMTIFLFIAAVTCPAQEVQADTTEEEETPDVWQAEEQILNPIHIEAVIEQPRVTLIPKRTDTPVEDLPLHYRSFDIELKAKPKLIDEYGKELENAARIEKLKKVLDKKEN